MLDIIYTLWYSIYMSSNKRMIYIYDENMAKYDALENKAEWVNQMLKELDDVPEEVDEKQTRIDDFDEKIRKIRNNG